MTADLSTIVGIAAGALTTISYLPQVVKAWKARSTGDLSLGMFVLLCAGIFLWVVYGVLIGSAPVIIANVVTLILASLVLVLKLKYG